jgi:hypothetical protein
MTDVQYVIWFIANAIVIVAVLAVGTLGAAGILTRHGRDLDKAARRGSGRRRTGPPAARR